MEYYLLCKVNNMHVTRPHWLFSLKSQARTKYCARVGSHRCWSDSLVYQLLRLFFSLEILIYSGRESDHIEGIVCTGKKNCAPLSKMLKQIYSELHFPLFHVN